MNCAPKSRSTREASTEAWQSLETEKEARAELARASEDAGAAHEALQAKFARSQEEESVLNQQLQSQSAEKEKLEKEVLDLLEQLEGQAALTEALPKPRHPLWLWKQPVRVRQRPWRLPKPLMKKLTEAHTVQENLKEKLTLLEEQISASSATSTELHEKLETITATLRETESVKESAQKALETLQSEKEALETELARLEAERILPEQLETLATEKQQVESALEEERSALTAARTSLESLQKESDDLRETSPPPIQREPTPRARPMNCELLFRWGRRKMHGCWNPSPTIVRLWNNSSRSVRKRTRP